MQEIQAVCSRIIIIHHGKLVADATAEQLIAATGAPEHSLHLTMAGDIQERTAMLAALPGVLNVKASPLSDNEATYMMEMENGAALDGLFYMNAGGQQLPIREVYSEHITLEDAFISLTNGEALMDRSDETGKEGGPKA